MKLSIYGYLRPLDLECECFRIKTKSLYDPMGYLEKLDTDGSEVVVDIEIRLSKKGNLVALVRGASYV